MGLPNPDRLNPDPFPFALSLSKRRLVLKKYDPSTSSERTRDDERQLPV
jgi:hypothetical protein